MALQAWAQPKVSKTLFSAQESISHNKVTAMVVDSRGLLWITTWGGLYRYDGYRFTSFPIKPGDGSELANARLDDIIENERGQLVCRSYDKNYIFDYDTNRFHRYDHEVDWHALTPDYLNGYSFVRDGYQMTIRDHCLWWNGEVLENGIKSAYVDRNGIVWIAKDDYVLERIVVTRPLYTFVDAGENVLALFHDSKGYIWQGNNDGTVMLRDKTGSPIGYVDAKGNISKGKSQLCRAYSFAEDREGRIYIGTRLNGLFVATLLDHSHVSLAHYMPDKNDRYSLSDDNVYTLLCDRYGRMWVGTYTGGLNLMERQGDRVRFLNRFNDYRHFPPTGRSYCMRSMTEVGKVIAIGTSDGIYAFDASLPIAKTTFYHHARKADDAWSLPSNEITDLANVNGKLVVSMPFSGLSMATADGLLSTDVRFTTWNTNDGAPSDRALRTFTDGRGNLWEVYNDVLARINLEQRTSSEFLTDGEGFTFSNYGKRVLLDNGDTWLPSDKGIVAFQLDTLEHKSHTIPILITSLKANNKDVPYAITSDTLRLDKTQHSFTIEFAALALDGSSRVNYAYRLEGMDDEWTITGSNRNISFNDLEAGTYTLLIRSTDNSRTWLDNTRRITIIVAPTFWESGWGLLIKALGFLAQAAIVIGIILYIYRLRLNVGFEHKMAEVKLKYFTDISHELRTPLTLIAGPISEMMHDETLSTQNQRFMALVNRNAQRMLTLVNQILDFRKIEERKMQLFVEKLDVLKEVERIVEDFRFVAKEKEIDLQLVNHCQEGTCLWADKDKFHKMLINLLSNAFKYTDPHHRVWVELQETEQSVSIAVGDTGRGIPKNKQKRIFQRFETLLNDSGMQFSSGIGLALVKELALLHHADISVASEEGEGSVFTLTFKKGNEHFAQNNTETKHTGEGEEGLAETTENEAGEAAESRPRLLLVEDEEDMRLFVRNVLENLYDITTACDGQDALEKVESIQPELIISDIQMPRMDGWQLVEHLKNDSKTSHLPVVLLTAKTAIDDRIRGARLGVADYIAKPFNTDYLKARLQSILQNIHEQQQHNIDELIFKGGISLEMPKDNSGVKNRMIKEDAEMLNRLKDFMEEHLMDDLPIQEMADHLALSRTLFYNKIKHLTGLTPLDFYRKYHVERAAQLIRNEGLTVTEACYRTGFSAPKYFSRIFKKFMGVTPSGYRQG